MAGFSYRLSYFLLHVSLGSGVTIAVAGHSWLAACDLAQVVEQSGQWYCEYDGKTYPTMVRRYVTTLRCTDNTAELTLNAFNEQVGQSSSSTARNGIQIITMHVTTCNPAW